MTQLLVQSIGLLRNNSNFVFVLVDSSLERFQLSNPSDELLVLSSKLLNCWFIVLNSSWNLEFRLAHCGLQVPDLFLVILYLLVSSLHDITQSLQFALKHRRSALKLGAFCPVYRFDSGFVLACYLHKSRFVLLDSWLVSAFQVFSNLLKPLILREEVLVVGVCTTLSNQLLCQPFNLLP